MNNFQNYREYSEYHYQQSQNLKNSLRGSSYNQQHRPNSNQSPTPMYRVSPSPKFESTQPSYPIYKAQNPSGNRPPTPVYLREQSREELYNKQLRQSIGNKLNLQNRNLPIFPMMDDQNSLASETMVRPGSFRPGSASNPDFMLPKDVQFYYKQKEKIFNKLEVFYGEEKKGIEEMMDECLKSIITIFEDHKQDLFRNLDDDKATFSKVYSRFSEGVDSFLKTAETRLENNLKAYETRILKIQEDEQNPLSTHIEKLKLEKEMINSKERIIREIKQSYEKSTIPWDKQKIGELMMDEYKKKHSANVSNLAQHMQKMIGGLKKSIEDFNTFKNYSTLEIGQDKTKNELKSQNQVNYGMGSNQGNGGINPMVNGMVNPANMGFNNQNVMNAQFLQNLAQMGISPNFMGNIDAYQMALLKAQMGIKDPKNMGKINEEILTNKYPNETQDVPKEDEWLARGDNRSKSKDIDQRVPKIRPAIKSPSQKIADLKKEEQKPKGILVNKKSVTFNLTNSQAEGKQTENKTKVDYMGKEDIDRFRVPEIQREVPTEAKPEEEDINEVIRKYKKREMGNDQNPSPKEERAKSPILEAKESINQLNEIYAQSKQKLKDYNNMGGYDYLGKYNPESKGLENDILKRKSVPVKEDHITPGIKDPRDRLQSYQGYMDKHQGMRNTTSDLQSIPKMSGFPVISKQRFDKNILKPKDKKKLEMDINRLGEKYKASKARPLSQNMKTIRTHSRPSTSTYCFNL